MFRKWCRERGFLNNKNISHVLMDGGVLSVPYDQLDSFYSKYTEVVNKNEKIFVVEQKTSIYNFFVDVDYTDEQALHLEDVEDICQCICKIVLLFKVSKAIVCISKPKPKGNLIKTGIHINWENFPVDQETALNIREHIINSLSESRPTVEWGNVIDKSVYGDIEKGSKGSGFRMPWSHKKSKHQACMGGGCENCHNGKIVEGPYLPFFLINETCSLTRISQDPSPKILWMTTIRTDTQECNTSVPKAEKKEGDFTKSQVSDRIVNIGIQAKLNEFIKRNLKGQERSRVHDVFRYKGNVLVKTNSKFCENINREHNSNHVWFIIRENGEMCQKCFCTCETLKGRKNGLCRDFEGRKHRIPPKIKDELFANKKIKEINNGDFTSYLCDVFNLPTAYP